MPYGEDDFLPVSALQHVTYCPRRAMLVTIEGIWADDAATVDGTIVHERADDPGFELREGIHVSRAVPLRSVRLGLHGRADLVEFHPVPSSGAGVALPGRSGFWRPVPVEFKRGKKRHERAYEVQVCAQAFCLEEMLGVPVPSGSLYYAQTRRRMDLVLDDPLRRETEAAVATLRQLFDSGRTPPAVFGPKCEKCSIQPLCLPEVTDGHRRTGRYLAGLLGPTGGDTP